MGQPVVHFEVIGQEPEKLRSFYGGLFAWEFDTSGTRGATSSSDTSPTPKAT